MSRRISKRELEGIWVDGTWVCPPGYHMVLGYLKRKPSEPKTYEVVESIAYNTGNYGMYVREHCAKNPKRRRR